MQLRLYGVRTYSSLGIGERYHEPLRQIYQKTKFDHPMIHSPLTMHAIIAMNDTMEENSLVLSRLVFRILSRFAILISSLPAQKEITEALKTAQTEMNSIVAKRSALATVIRDIPLAAERTYKLGEEALAHSKN